MTEQAKARPATLRQELGKGFKKGFVEGGKKLSKSDVEKNIWVPASLTLGIFVGHIMDVEKTAWLILIGAGITLLWGAIYLGCKALKVWS